ncbi:hypothetical protein [Sinomonas humi]|uniref:hypothetical protein n=1 Tax=Sinomonas humi TaxID=1338436 RepID=UPI0018CEBA92|nr:hypothetical protein [Sinomonas humi]
MTPPPAQPIQGTASAAPISFGDLPSVRAMGTGRAGIVVGFDTEFTTTGSGTRVIDSYQFAVPHPLDPAFMVEMVILPLDERRISLHAALWEVVVAARLWHSPFVPDGVDDRGVRRDRVLAEPPNGTAKNAALAWEADARDWEARAAALAPWRVPIVLASHYGSADLTAFRDDRFVTDHLTRLTSAAGGLVTLLPFRLQRGDGQGDWWRVLSVTVRDTMGHAPAGKKSLSVIGPACDVPKLEVPDNWIFNMTGYRAAHLVDFLEYGVNDAVIVVEYLARLWGDGVIPPITLSGGAAAALVAAGSDYFGVQSPSDFRLLFAGLVQEDGVEIVDEDDQLSFYGKRLRRPVDGAADQLMSAYAKAYHGGLNACSAPGYYPHPTVDIDAQNAYPTAMSLVQDLDWEVGVIDTTVNKRRLTLADVPEPTTPIVGFVSFAFPPDVGFPCLPIVADNTLVYPRTSEGTAGTWACGPELWLALTLGAEVFCQIGYTATPVTREDGSPSRVLRHGVKQLIDDRNTAKVLFGAKSIEEQTLKTAASSVYGKTAQDVAEQRAWNAHEQQMDSVGGSAITSPYHAATSTSLVRAQLLATMNQITERGGAVYSVTTDGFITDMTLDDVNDLDLYGLADHLQEARTALTGDPAIWEDKHRQNDLVNFTTRGNVSLSPGGVCAHNGIKRPEGVDEDSPEDREHLLTLVVTRTGRVENKYKRFPSFSELSRKDNRKDFLPSWVSAPRSMDFDLKRRPVMGSMTAEFVPLPDGSRHEMATFTTEPWETVEECLRAREIAREMSKTGCLRTVDEWAAWHIKYTHGKGRRIVTAQRSVLMSIVMAHRQGIVSIPTLADRSMTVTDKIAWLAQWGLGTVSEGDWKNARRPERTSQMLPLHALDPYLHRMLAMPFGASPGDADRLPY